MEGDKPTQVFVAGAIRAAIWYNTIERNGQQVHVPSIQVDRSFKHDNDWKRTSRFNTADLPKVELVVRKAFEFLSFKEQHNGSTNSD